MTTLTIGGITGLYDEDSLRNQHGIPDEVIGLELQHAVNRIIVEEAVNEERNPETGELIAATDDSGCEADERYAAGWNS